MKITLTSRLREDPPANRKEPSPDSPLFLVGKWKLVSIQVKMDGRWIPFRRYGRGTAQWTFKNGHEVIDRRSWSDYYTTGYDYYPEEKRLRMDRHFIEPGDTEFAWLEEQYLVEPVDESEAWFYFIDTTRSEPYDHRVRLKLKREG